MGYAILNWTEQFSLLLVGLALIICASGSFTVFALLGRALAANGRNRWLWLGGISVGFGADVWATHFIAMLAYDPRVSLTYRVGPTVLSVVIAIAGGMPAFAAVILRPSDRRVRVLAGLVLGLAIGAMHFVGMSAMQMDMPATQGPVFAIVGLAAGMTLCALAMSFAGGPGQPSTSWLATTFLILGICSLHFIAMGGYAVMVPHTIAVLAGDARHATSLWLALTVAGVSLLFLFSAGIAVFADLEFVALRQRESVALDHAARHDELTHLPNRLFLQEHLGQTLLGSPEQRSFALFHIDLDRFKPVNDLYGPHTGDVVLAEAAARIQGLIRGSDLVARFGEDEFVILQRDSKTEADAAALAERLVRRLADPITANGHILRLGASVGITLSSDRTGTIEDVLRDAGVALHAAKSAGGGAYRFFAPEMSEQLLAQRSLEMDLLAALDAEQFELAYQPVFDCRTGRLLGFEALLRWRHPTRGMVSPMAFIPLAERSGLIVRLGLWVLRTACATAAAWPNDIGIAVNLSPVQLRDSDVVTAVLDVLAQTGLAPSRLELEITEGVLIESPEQARAAMTTLKGHGVRFAIDDFGTGHSSLSSLHSFPFDRIKIDQSFTRGLAANAKLAAIVAAITSLGDALGLDVLAEGVETQEQLSLLRRQNCGQVQGYLLGRPEPAASAAALIARQEAAEENGLAAISA